MNADKTFWFSKLLFAISGAIGQLGYAFDRPENLRNFWCRLRGHPAGQVWYSSGLEPDYHCTNCGEEI